MMPTRGSGSSGDLSETVDLVDVEMPDYDYNDDDKDGLDGDNDLYTADGPHQVSDDDDKELSEPLEQTGLPSPIRQSSADIIELPYSRELRDSEEEVETSDGDFRVRKKNDGLTKEARQAQLLANMREDPMFGNGLRRMKRNWQGTIHYYYLGEREKVEGKRALPP